MNFKMNRSSSATKFCPVTRTSPHLERPELLGADNPELLEVVVPEAPFGEHLVEVISQLTLDADALGGQVLLAPHEHCRLDGAPLTLVVVDFVQEEVGDVQLGQVALQLDPLAMVLFFLGTEGLGLFQDVLAVRFDVLLRLAEPVFGAVFFAGRLLSEL